MILQERIKVLVPDRDGPVHDPRRRPGGRRHHRGPRPADRRFDQRLHDQPVRATQAVHPHRHDRSTSCSSSGSPRRTRSSRSRRSSSCSSSARTSPRVRSRATCPDLVPPPQVGLASGHGRPVHGPGRRRRHARSPRWASRTGDFAARRSCSASSSSSRCCRLFFRLDEGRAAKDRGGRSVAADRRWRHGARDVLQERSFMFLVASRFFILGGGAFLIGSAGAVPRTGARASTNPDERAILDPGHRPASSRCARPSRRSRRRGSSDRYGRKRGDLRGVRWSAAIGHDDRGARAVGRASWSSGRSSSGVGSGSFLAVDWALMTDIIPKASSGRYMGISNVATATNGVVSAIHRRRCILDGLARRSSPGSRGGPDPVRAAAIGAVPAPVTRRCVSRSRSAHGCRGWSARATTAPRAGAGSRTGPVAIEPRDERPEVDEVVEPDRARPEPEQRLELDDRQRQQVARLSRTARPGR